MKKPSEIELLNYNVAYSKDSDFSAFARLLQSKWREKKGYPYANLGNFLELQFAKTTKANFLTENIKTLVTNAVANAKHDRAMIGEPRIWNNLLSSQPLCFNLFGELYYDLKLATKYFKELFPNRIEEVTSIKFEYSAGRGNKAYTGDHSAFDVFVEYNNLGKRGFIGMEVKYAESLKEETQEKANETYLRHEEQYLRLTTLSHFKKDAILVIKQVPVSQIWRDHLLSLAHLKDYDEGFFVFLFPKENSDCQNGVNEYKKYLASEFEVQTGFYSRYLEEFIKTLKIICNESWVNELEERYLGEH